MIRDRNQRCSSTSDLSTTKLEGEGEERMQRDGGDDEELGESARVLIIITKVMNL